MYICAFSALTLLAGWQEEHLAHKNVSDELSAWLSIWSEVQCLVYGSANATAIPEWFVLMVPAHLGSPGRTSRAIKR